MIIGATDSLMDFKSNAISDYSSQYKNQNSSAFQKGKSEVDASVKLSLSKEAQGLIMQENGLMSPINANEKTNKDKEKDKNKLTDEEKSVVEKLKARDSEVKTHEQQHLAASGGYAKGGAHYTYQKGPDGKMYAIGGHVSMDTSMSSDNPEANLAKAQIIARAALSPQGPSGADRAVAAKASAIAMQARADIHKKNSGESSDELEGNNIDEAELSENGLKRNRKKLRAYLYK